MNLILETTKHMPKEGGSVSHPFTNEITRCLEFASNNGGAVASGSGREIQMK